MPNRIFLFLLIGLHSILLAQKSEFERSIVAYVDSVAPGARLGLSVRSIRGDSIVYQLAGNEWFVPASTLKLLLTATAVQSLDLNYAPQTVIYLEGVQKGRTFTGVVRLQGRGDPNISGRYFTSAMQPLEGLVDSLRARGIDSLRGKVEWDTSYYNGGRKPIGWRRNYFDAWYGAEISPLSFNDNCVLLEIKPGVQPGDSVSVRIDPDVGHVQVVNRMKTTKGSRRKWYYAIDSVQSKILLTGELGVQGREFSVVLPVRNPAMFFRAAFVRALKERRVEWIEDSLVAPSLAMDSVIYAGPPLRSLLDEINQRSQNLHAEMLLRNLGQWRWKDGSAAAGLSVERLFLHESGLPATDFYLVDGSGLSPDNRLKPHALTKLLSYMARQPRHEIYMQSLGIPGVTGATSRRLNGIDAAHRSRFKTGFINGVHGLAGYMGTQSGDTLALAIYLNDVGKLPDSKGRALVDSIWGRLATLYNRDFLAVKEAQQLWLSADTLHGLSERLDYFSEQLKGRPYLLGATGEGRAAVLEKGPLIHLDAFDCVTYIEHVMALATAPSAELVFDELQRIRYFNGNIRFTSRKHYFVEDWIGGNSNRVRLVEHASDSVVNRVMDKKKFFANKGLAYLDSNPVTRVPFMPMDSAIAFASKTWTAADTVMGVGFVANFEGIGVTHTGFVVARKGHKPVLRHASQLLKQTTDQSLESYLLSRKGKSPGVLFFEFLPLQQ